MTNRSGVGDGGDGGGGGVWYSLIGVGGLVQVSACGGGDDDKDDNNEDDDFDTRVYVHEGGICSSEKDVCVESLR